MALYKYQSIDLDRPAVRLVRLRKGYAKDEIICNLFDGWINQLEGGVPYDALSYTWGSTEKVAQITVDGSTMHVTSNLFIALQHLRFVDEDRILWIDAICIDQDNPHERTHQVQQMGHIYKEAEQVIIWLGEGTKETDFVMDSITQLHENNVKYGGDWRLLAQHWMNHQAVAKFNLEGTERWKEGMKMILKRPWFSRIWILQEIANARVAKVLCGKKSVSARTLAQFPSLIGLQPDPHRQAILDIMPGLSRKESWWSHKRNLHTLLVKFRKSLATDERDIIYALLGLSSDACSSDFLHPDYTKSLQEVIRDTVSFLLPHTNQDKSLYNFLDWTLSEFLQGLDSLSDAVFGSALKSGKEGAVKLLFEMNRSEEDWKDKNDWLQMKLQQAVQDGDEAIAGLLLANGAKLEARDKNGRTALSSAVSTRNTPIVQFLLEKGAMLETKDEDGRTPLSWATTHGYKDIIELLLEKGAELNTEDKDGRTPLSWAVTRGDRDIVQFLLMKGSKLEVKDKDGRTPLSWAATSGNKAIIQFLFKMGADLETKDSSGRTPLSLAVMRRNKSVVQLLLETEDNDGQTPLMLAERERLVYIAEWLRTINPE